MSPEPPVPMSERLLMALAWGYAARFSQRNYSATVTSHVQFGHAPEGWASLPVATKRDPERERHAAPILSVGNPSNPMLVFDRRLGVLVKMSDHLLQVADWDELLAAESAHEILKQVEKRTWIHVKPPRSTPAPSRQALTYLAIARILTARVLDPQRWSAQSLEVPANADLDVHEVLQHVLGPFRTARTAAAQYSDVEIEHDIWGHHYHEPVRPLWMIRRGEVPVLVLDEAGKAHLRTQVSIDLYDLYRKLGNDIDAAASILLVEPPEHARLIAMRATLDSHMFH